MRILPIEAIVIGWFARRGRSPILGGLIVWMAVTASLIAVPSLYGVGYLRDTILPVALQLVVSGLMAVVVADLLATFAVARKAGRARRAAGAPSPRRRVSRVRARRDGAGAGARVGGRTAVVGEAGSRRRRPPPRSGGRAQPAHRRLRRRSRARRASRSPPRSPACRATMRDGSSCSCATTTSIRASSPSSSPISSASSARSFRRAIPSRRRSAIASTSSTRCRPSRRRSPTSSSAGSRTCRSSPSPCRSSTPPAAIAGVAGGSLDLSKFDQFVTDFGALPNARITVVDQHARVIFTSGETSSPPLQSLALDDMVLAQLAGAERRLPLRPQDRERHRLGAAGGVGGDAADRLEGVRRTAARLHPPAVDRLLRVRACADAGRLRRRGARRPRLRPAP